MLSALPLRLLVRGSLVALAPRSWAQSTLSERIQSQNALRDLESEIEEFSARIDATRADEQTAMATLRELDAELGLREDLIASYRGRLRLLNARTARPVPLTAMGFGAAGLGNLFRRVSDDDAQATIQAAYDAGIRYFDTAPQYGLGRSETRVGAALARLGRDKVQHST